MSYLVIARKYRPVDFDEMVGQDTIVKTLRNAVDENRLSHAYLFSGTRGIGKTSVARILARALNCVKGPTSKPCNKCESCVDILNGASLDVIEIDGASNRRVEETQQIIENVQYAPARDRYKVYIIDEVHMLSMHAFNALLKTLEEPPSHVVFILATTEYSKIPQTIRSRTQHFHFPNIPQDVIANNLKKICGLEGIKISERALFLISRQAAGSVRDAQSLLDQVIAFSGSDVSDKDVETVLGVVRGEILDRFIRAVGERNPAELIRLTAETYESGYDLNLISRELLERFRNLILLKIDRDKLLEIVTLSRGEAQQAVELADVFTEAQLLLIFDILSEAENRMKYSAFSRYVLETALIKAAEAERLVDIGTLLGALSGRSDDYNDTHPADVSEENYKNAKSPFLPDRPRITNITPYSQMSEKEASSYKEGKPVKKESEKLVEEIMNRVYKKSRTLFAKLGGTKSEVKDGNLVIFASHKAIGVLRKQMDEDRQAASVILEACREVLGENANFLMEEYIPEDLEKAAVELKPEEVQKRHSIDKLTEEPVVQKLIDTFKIDVNDIKVKPYKDSNSE